MKLKFQGLKLKFQALEFLSQILEFVLGLQIIDSQCVTGVALFGPFLRCWRGLLLRRLRLGNVVLVSIAQIA